MKNIITIFITIFIISSAYSKVENHNSNYTIPLNINSLQITPISTGGLRIGFRQGKNDKDTTYAFNVIGSNITYETLSKEIIIIGSASLTSAYNSDTLAIINQDTILSISELITSGWIYDNNKIQGNTIIFNGTKLFIEKIKLFTTNKDSARTDSSGFALGGRFLFENISWDFKLDSLTWCYRSKKESKILPEIRYQINDTLKFAGISMILLNTNFFIDEVTNTSGMYGDSILFSYAQDTLIVGFGNFNHPGIEFKKDTLKRLQLEINDSIEMFGIKLIADSLIIKYNSLLKSFSIFCDTLEVEYGRGSSEDSISTKRLLANLGTENDPGFLIKNGKLNHLRFGISDSLNYKGIKIDVHNTNIEYDIPNNYFKFFGGPMNMDINGDTIGIDFGLVNNPGLLIKKGKLEEFNVGLTGKGQILGFDFKSNSLRLEWIVEHSQFEINSGSLTLLTDSSSINRDSLLLNFIAPGLVIQNGEITEFNAAITENIHLKGLEFKTDSLIVAYDKNEDNIKIFDGVINLHFGQDSLIIKCGSILNPGFVLHKGNLKNANFDINTEIKMKGFVFDAFNLNLLYIDTLDIFGISGDSIIMHLVNDSIKGENIGIEFRNGDIDKFSMGINHDFNLKTLELKPIDLTFAYNNGKFELYDSLLIKIDSNKIKCSLGDKQNPGLILNNGSVEAINISVSSDLKIGGLNFKVVNAGIQWPMLLKHKIKTYNSHHKLIEKVYTSSHDTVALFGDFKLKELWNADLNIGTKKQPGIEIKKNLLGKSIFHIENLSLKLEEVNLAGLTIEEMEIQYKHDFIKVNCTAIIENAFETDGKITLSKSINNSYKIDSFYLDFNILPPDEGIPLGATDLFLQGISAGYDFDNNIFKGGMSFSDGISYEHGVFKGFFMYLDGNATISNKHITSHTDLNLGAYYNRHANKWESDIGEAKLNVDLNWKKKNYTLSGTLKIPTDYGIKIDGLIKLKENVKVFSGDVGIQIPKNWKIIGGKKLGNVGGALLIYKYHHKKSFAAGWTHFKIGCTSCSSAWCGGNWSHCLLNKNIGIEYKFHDKRLYRIGSSSIHNIKKKIKNSYNAYVELNSEKSLRSYEVEINEDAFGDLLNVKILFSQPISIKDIEVIILGPNGLYPTRINLFDTTNGFYHYDPKIGQDVIIDELFLLITEAISTDQHFKSFSQNINTKPKTVALQRGIYEIIIYASTSIETSVETVINHSNTKINIEVNHQEGSNIVDIKTYSWIPQVSIESKFDKKSNSVIRQTHEKNEKYSFNLADINIFVDNDSIGYDGRLITNNKILLEERANNIQVYNTQWRAYGNKPDEKYYFYCILRDSLNVPHRSKYSQSISIDPLLTGQIINVNNPNEGISEVLVFLDLNKNEKLDLNRLVNKKDSTKTNKIELPEPSTYTDSLGYFYFDVNRNSNIFLENNLYQLEYYLPNKFKTDSNSNFKRGDLINFEGKPINVEIKIKKKK